MKGGIENEQADILPKAGLSACLNFYLSSFLQPVFHNILNDRRIGQG